MRKLWCALAMVVTSSLSGCGHNTSMSFLFNPM